MKLIEKYPDDIDAIIHLPTNSQYRSQDQVETTIKARLLHYKKECENLSLKLSKAHEDIGQSTADTLENSLLNYETMVTLLPLFHDLQVPSFPVSQVTDYYHEVSMAKIDKVINTMQALLGHATLSSDHVLKALKQIQMQRQMTERIKGKIGFLSSTASEKFNQVFKRERSAGKNVRDFMQMMCRTTNPSEDSDISENIVKSIDIRQKNIGENDAYWKKTGRLEAGKNASKAAKIKFIKGLIQK